MKHLLRKHGKVIMTVMSVLLMITFSMQSGWNRGDATTQVIGRLNGKKFYGNQYQDAKNELDIIRRYELVRQVGDRYQYDPRFFFVATLDERDSATHWYLLLQEAKNRGIVAPAAAVTEEMDQLQKEGKISEEQTKDPGWRDTIAHGLMVSGLFQSLEQGKPWSLPEIEYLADWRFSKVEVAYATLSADRGWEAAPMPSAEQIQKQYDLYKGVVRPMGLSWVAATIPTVDGHTYPFGYKYPDRVKVEYLVFDRAEFRKKFVPTAEDYDAAFKYYTANPDKFTADSPSGVVATRSMKSFDEVKDRLVSDQIDERVDRLLKKMTDRVQALTSDPWKNAVEATIPQDKWADYEKIKAAVAQNKEYMGYEPRYHNSGAASPNPMSAEEVARLPDGIGDASFKPQNQPEILFARLATSVKELVDLGSKDQIGRLDLHVGREGPLLTDSKGNVYLYRVAEVSKSHDPASLDEVRSQVVEDLKKLANYFRKQSEAKDLVSGVKAGAAGSTDLLAKLAKERDLSVGTAKDLTRVNTVLPDDVRGVKGFVEAAFSMVTPELQRQGASKAAQSASQPTTQPASVVPSQNLATSLDSEALLKVYAMQLEQYTGVAPALFSAIRQQLILYPDADMEAFSREWFGLDSLAARLKYVPAQPFPKKSES